MTDFGWDYPTGVTPRMIDQLSEGDDMASEAEAMHANHDKACMVLDKLLEDLTRWHDEALEAGDCPDQASRWLKVARAGVGRPDTLTRLAEAMTGILASLDGIARLPDVRPGGQDEDAWVDRG